jgi:hypothetical protein
MNRIATVRGSDVHVDGERYLAFDSPTYAEAFALGWNEAVEGGRISDFGRTHVEDQDWNEAYDAGRNARIDAEGLADQDTGR